MIVSRWKIWAGVFVTLVLTALWWFYGADWLVNKPQSPRVGWTYIAVVIVSSVWHFRALYRFNKMTRMLRAEERAGIAPVGSTTFAANQRFRYLMRSIESVLVFILGVLIIISAYRPKVATNPNYLRLILTYFIGSVLLTGFLTIRDLWVLNTVRKINESEDDNTALTAIKNTTTR